MTKKSTRFERVAPMPNYNELIDLLPSRGFGYARRVAKLLNYNKLKPTKALEYSTNSVHQTVHKGHFDVNIEPALIQVVEEYYGQKLSVILPTYTRRFPKKAFKRPKEEAVV